MKYCAAMSVGVKILFQISFSVHTEATKACFVSKPNLCELKPSSSSILYSLEENNKDKNVSEELCLKHYQS